MADAKIFGFLVLLLLLVPFVSAATCAEKSYDTSCKKCSFENQTGKMDQACYEGYQNRGIACLFAAYPAESIKYKMGDCPAIQACVDKLQGCKALYTTGNDKYDCSVETIDHCFIRGDACVADAVKHCDKPSPETVADEAPPASWCDGFMFPLGLAFMGAFVGRRK